MSNFISASGVFADVRQMLSSYDAAGLINDQDLFRWTRYIVNQFGTISTRDESILLTIENFKAELPEDFSLIKAVYICDVDEDLGTSTYTGHYGRPQTFILKDWWQSTCYDKCHVCYDGQVHYVTRTLSKEFSVPKRCNINTRVPLSIDRSITKEKCSKDCINIGCKCEYSFNITENTIHTNFECGNIHLMYYALPVDEEGYPLIIEDPILEQAVEDYLIFKCLQKIMYNGEADVQQRMMFAKQEHILSLREALHFVKLPTFSSLVEYAKKRKNYLSLFNIESNSDYNGIQYQSQRFKS